MWAQIAMQAGKQAVQDIGTISSVIQSRGDYRIQARQAEQQAKMAMLAAEQDENARRGQLESVLATQAAIRSAGGLDPYSEGGRVITDTTRDNTAANISAQRLTYLNQAEAFSQSADVARFRRRQAIGAGVLTHVGNVFQTGSNMASSIRGTPAR